MRIVHFALNAGFDLISRIGKSVNLFTIKIGSFVIFIYKLLSSLLSRKFFFKNFLDSMLYIGFCSIPVVTLTGIFTGIVITVQLYYALLKFGVTDTIPTIVLVGLLKELGPVLCGLMIVARVGSSMVAEIGGMKINNQIDALTSLAVDPFKFLYIPRILATTIAMPLLCTILSIIGIMGSFFIMTMVFNFSPNVYVEIIINSFDFYDYNIGMIKSIIFGFIISLTACYNGSNARDGSVGVGYATVKTVVACCVYVLFFNFLVTVLMVQ